VSLCLSKLEHIASVFTRHTKIKRIYKGCDRKISGDKFNIYMPLLYMPVGTVSIVLVLQSNMDQAVVVQCRYQ